VSEETQLLFKGHSSSVDSVKFLNEELIISGSQDGALGIWSLTKKNPLCMLQAAHGRRREEGIVNGEEKEREHCWISSVSAVLNSDLVCSGSYDGFLRFWKFKRTPASLSPVAAFPVPGVINQIATGNSGRVAVAAVGKEHRFGRWFTLPQAKNGIAIIPLRLGELSR